jgi:natural product precursor
MKKLSQLVLVELESRELSGRQMKKLKGGNHCVCGCCYAGGGGGSSSNMNADANCDGNLYSTCGSVSIEIC